ncbi:MAG: SDR family NAD(P)-dependent oxidoreductase [Spirochaetes bacterium]|nr:SDR family NAD(P)-dependent oxidoreductase [Spirochaetota bacterium]
MEISGSTIVITGASRGLGREMALRLSRAGARVILVARSEESLQSAQRTVSDIAGYSPDAFPCDITDEWAVAGIARTIGATYRRVDALINNAGIGILKPVSEMSGDEMRRHFEVNLFGAFYCTRAMLPLMKGGKEGYVLNIGSLLGEMSFAESGVYSATKFALAGFTEGLRLELKKHGIQVGLLLPGPMNTSFHENVGGHAPDVPRFITLDPARVAVIAEMMIRKRVSRVHAYRWILYAMKLKRFLR